MIARARCPAQTSRTRDNRDHRRRRPACGCAPVAVPRRPLRRLAALDISSVDDVDRFDWQGVTTIINAAAYTKVDECETPEGMVKAWLVNSQGVANLAAVARRRDLTLVHFSSDYVFDRVDGPPCTEDEPIRPESAYGASKAAGELAARAVTKHYVVRTSWMYHPCARNFVATMLALAKERTELSVVNDQLGRPTHAGDLADVLVDLLSGEAPFGVYHVQNDGPVVSWAEFAATIFSTAGLSTRVLGISARSTERRSAGANPAVRSPPAPATAR